MLFRGQVPSRGTSAGFVGSGLGARGRAKAVVSNQVGPTPPRSTRSPGTEPLRQSARALVSPPRFWTRLLLLLEKMVNARPPWTAAPPLTRQPPRICAAGPDVAMLLPRPNGSS